MYFGSLSEEFLLIVLDNKSGRIRENMSPHLSIGLIGGILLDLMLQGRLTIEKNNIIIVDETPTDNELLNLAFEVLKEEEDKLPILYWIRKLRYQFSNIDQMILDKLVQKELLYIEERKKYWIFPDRRYFLVKPEFKEIIKHNIHQIVTIKCESDYQTLAMLSLIYATNCTTEIFTEDELETYMQDIRNLVASDEIGQSIATAINNIIDALMRTLIISSSYAY
ncbi:MAG: GOLPH3/VPS74 family protein [Candidatus Kariarchaeaceae archaeon]|jgi:hypothetical protein